MVRNYWQLLQHTPGLFVQICHFLSFGMEYVKNGSREMTFNFKTKLKWHN